MTAETADTGCEFLITTVIKTRELMPTQPLLCNSTSFASVDTEDEKLDEPSVLILRPVWVGVGLR